MQIFWLVLTVFISFHRKFESPRWRSPPSYPISPISKETRFFISRSFFSTFRTTSMEFCDGRSSRLLLRCPLVCNPLFMKINIISKLQSPYNAISQQLKSWQSWKCRNQIEQQSKFNRKMSSFLLYWKSKTTTWNNDLVSSDWSKNRSRKVI